MEKPTRFPAKKPNSPQAPNKHLGVESEYTKPSVSAGGARLEFDTPAVRKLVDDRGLDVAWEQSWLCTCRHPETLQPDSSCPICYGKGVAYEAPVSTVVAIQSQEKGISSIDLGIYDSGTAIGTAYSGDKMSFRDRITVPDVKIIQSMVFNVTQRRIEHGFYMYYDVRSIIMARGVINGTQGSYLVENEDYTVDYTRNIFYPKEHLLNTNVSLNIETVLRYIIIDLLKESRYQYTELHAGNRGSIFEELPRKLLLKREDIFINPEAFAMTSNTHEAVREANKEDFIHTKRETKDRNSSGFFGMF